MKKLIVRKFTPKSVFKAVLMSILIPFIVILLVTMIALLTGTHEYGGFSVLGTVLYLLLSPFIYGLIFMLFAASYNWLAPRFGGLEIEIADENAKSNDMEKEVSI